MSSVNIEYYYIVQYLNQDKYSLKNIMCAIITWDIYC